MKHSTLLKTLAIISLTYWGGGILVFAILSNLNAITLQEICPDSNNCKINNNKHYGEVTNRDIFSMTNSNAIQLSDMTNGQDGIIDTFINYGTIRSSYSESIKIEKKGYIGNLINYGTITGHIYIGNANEKGAIGTITNYGVMGSIYTSASTPTQPIDITINNFGIMKAHADGTGGGVNDTSNLNASAGNITFTLQNYSIKINEKSGEFNNFSGNQPNTTAIKNSHLVINTTSGGSVRFKDGDSKIILDFGFDFELGTKYLINKIATDKDGNPYAALGVDFSRLVPYSDIYSLSQSGEYFIATLNTGASTIGNLYKANVRTMNNFYTISNSMIYPRKSYHSQNLRISSLRADSQNLRGNPNISSLRDLPTANRGNPQKALDSAISLKSYESFAYRNESINRRIQRQNKRNYNRKLQNQTQNLKENQSNSQNLKTDSANKTNKTNQNNLRDSANRDYYFILTPFVNHNLFFESGRYNLRGLEYGFLTAFSGKITPSNVLGTHFMMSYGNIGDSKDKDFNITNLNLNIGLNYKLDLVWDMYLKARGDFFYFLNQVKTLTMFEAIKPNNLGFGLSVIFGKDFDFGKGGMLGIEAGIDYKALKTNEVSLNSQTYKQSLYNLIYADVGMNYNKYFGGFGINLGTGFKANLAPKLAESILILNSQNLTFTLDNDKYLAYANAGISYLLNHKNFDMEFSLAYYGNFGDRAISNGGGVEWRVVW